MQAVNKCPGITGVKKSLEKSGALFLILGVLIYTLVNTFHLSDIHLRLIIIIVHHIYNY